ncbi:Uncharacterised protein [Mycobacteroides abscessus subsp. abscessus]|nr:Uncharacterised protein [Mycobacteroides abscessus]SIN58748.1 Uncharacterised protein [Mycobacteroides abscessus subsp. abscessus]SKV73131.1 Uncharacterised protein [Mycobacteroides abscessus subsp. abscessus]SKZ24072.1 Uncharacterised protein [Mycobacteroides abscessus subsp. abscessus]
MTCMEASASAVSAVIPSMLSIDSNIDRPIQQMGMSAQCGSQ